MNAHNINIHVIFDHRGLNRFHRGHAAYIPYILTRDATTKVAKPLPVLFQA